MAELLDQNEIDALLSAVDDGEVEGPDDSGPIQVFSNHNRYGSDADV